jgi:hypothetical protein
LQGVIILAQRLAAQPLGCFRVAITILAGNLKTISNVFSISLGQVGCSRLLGIYKNIFLDFLIIISIFHSILNL